MAAQLICNQWVAGSTPVTSSKKNPAIYRYNSGVYRGIFALSQCRYCPECATNSGKNRFEQLCAPLFCVLRLYPLCSGLPPEPKKSKLVVDKQRIRCYHIQAVCVTCKENMGVFPSGQWGQTVNLLLSASVVRIHPRPPKKLNAP